MELFVYCSRISASSNEVFDWHRRDGAFERLNPPWRPFVVKERKGGIDTGGYITVRMPIVKHIIGITWLLKHIDYIEGKQFRDIQISGPFSSWSHTHLFKSEDAVSSSSSSSVLEDRIEYSLPLGILGKLFSQTIINNKLKEIFEYRHRITSQDIHIHDNSARSNNSNSNIIPMTILLTGSTGFIGSALVPFLTVGGYRIIRLLRSQSPRFGKQFGNNTQRSVPWDPISGSLDLSSIEGVDAVVNLAGQNIYGRWTKEKKSRILSSRVQSTKFLCKSLASLNKPPKVLVSASAIGYYGSNNIGDEILSEDNSPPPADSRDFLSEVCYQWENATEIAKQAGIRVVNIRIGVVLGAAGGMLAKMLLPFKIGLGGKIANGKQWISWISLDDLLGIILHAINNESIKGPINAVVPGPVTNADFANTLAAILSKPAKFNIPSFIVKKVFGELADAALLASTRVVTSDILQKTGYQFRFLNLEMALRHTLGKTTIREDHKR